MSKPIKPSEVAAKKLESIPTEIIDAFNELIAENWKEGSKSSCFKKKEVITLIRSKLDISENDIYARSYLDIESVFKSAGWKVAYDKPGYNENYDGFYTFSV